MKIIGKSAGGYLVEMTSIEVVRAAGYDSTYDDGWSRAVVLAGNHSSREPVVGMKIDVDAAYNFHSRVAANETKAKEAAGTLRALANLLDGAIPSVVIPPASDAQATKGAEIA